ncbi:MAG: serpin family protein [bacterium]
MRLNRITKRVSVAAVALAAACSTIVEPAPEHAQVPKLTVLPRALSAAEQTLVSSANDFSFALFRQVVAANKDSNIFISPLSASMALGMTMNGASGTTHDQMRTALAFGTSTDSVINESYNGLIGLLRGLDPTVDVRIANSIWYERTLPVNQTFIDDSKRWFDAKVSALDFAQPSSATTINDWVSTATSGKIPRIIDDIRSDQVMFLINAIYYKGNWRDKFDAAQTKDTVFFGVSGNQPMRLMHRHGALNFLFTQQFAAVDLPYGNSAFSMTVLLPNQGTSIDQLASSLQSGAWASWMSGFHEITTDVWLPKLKLEWERTLNDDLKTLGLRDAFEPNAADFTRMSPAGRGLYIDKVKQKTYVDINEEGTEAAAVTSVGISTVSLPPSLRVDRPYIFVIRERLSGTIMFMGKIVRMP